MRIFSSSSGDSVRLESRLHPLPLHPPHAGDRYDAGGDDGGRDDEDPLLSF